jgi:hypothetical protein
MDFMGLAAPYTFGFNDSRGMAAGLILHHATRSGALFDAQLHLIGVERSVVGDL